MKEFPLLGKAWEGNWIQREGIFGERLHMDITSWVRFRDREDIYLGVGTGKFSGEKTF